MLDVLDASVWLPLSAPDHVRHQRARQYCDEQASDDVGFCRSTALALLRHLTSKQVLGARVLDGRQAWRAMETWLATPGVTFLFEPAGIDDLLRLWAEDMDLRGGFWSDAYLAAFAIASGCRLVAFESDSHIFPALQFLHLTP
jgi:uncharacterized protein